MATIYGRNVSYSILFIIQYIYTSVYALVGRIGHNESSVHGQESFKKETLTQRPTECLVQGAATRRVVPVLIGTHDSKYQLPTTIDPLQLTVM